MRKYDRVCPVCGRLNRELYLEETEGMMECEQCGSISCAAPGEENLTAAVLQETGRWMKWDWKDVMALLPGSEHADKSGVCMV